MFWFTIHALLSRLCVCVGLALIGMERKQREKTRKRKKSKNHARQKNNSFLPFSSFLFDFSLFFSLFFSLQKITKALKKLEKSTQMTDKKDVKAQSVDELEDLMEQGDTDAKRELAIRLMKGKGVPQNHPKAVALLEDCVALGDTDAMVVLAQCCALGRGMEHNAERAESLICEAANKGNHEAQSLMELINDWKGQQSIDLGCLIMALGRGFLDIHLNVYHRANQG